MSGSGIVAGLANFAVGTGNPRPTQSQSNPNANNNSGTPRPAPVSQEPQAQRGFGYYNSGTQNIKGLTNQTGYIRGNANGVINFGSLMVPSGAQRQA